MHSKQAFSHYNIFWIWIFWKNYHLIKIESKSKVHTNWWCNYSTKTPHLSALVLHILFCLFSNFAISQWESQSLILADFAFSFSLFLSGCNGEGFLLFFENGSKYVYNYLLMMLSVTWNPITSTLLDPSTFKIVDDVLLLFPLIPPPSR